MAKRAKRVSLDHVASRAQAAAAGLPMSAGPERDQTAILDGSRHARAARSGRTPNPRGRDNVDTAGRKGGK